MKISSEHINNLLAYARERHGAPCRVTLAGCFDRIAVYFQIYKTVERIEIDEDGFEWE